MPSAFSLSESLIRRRSWLGSSKTPIDDALNESMPRCVPPPLVVFGSLRSPCHGGYVGLRNGFRTVLRRTRSAPLWCNVGHGQLPGSESAASEDCPLCRPTEIPRRYGPGQQDLPVVCEGDLASEPIVNEPPSSQQVAA